MKEEKGVLTAAGAGEEGRTCLSRDGAIKGRCNILRRHWFCCCMKGLELALWWGFSLKMDYDGVLL